MSASPSKLDKAQPQTSHNLMQRPFHSQRSWSDKGKALSKN